MPKFAKELYVGWEGDKGEEYMVAVEKPEGISFLNDEREVGIYKFVEVVTLKSTEQFEFIRKPATRKGRE